VREETVILAVDDSSESLALLVELLTPAGYRVLPADSGELALAAVAVSLPDLILLDVKMRGLDGLEVCRRLKASEETRNIPVILISAFAEMKDWVAGLQLGAVDYITKPFHPEELLTRVRTHLSLRRASLTLERQAQVFRAANVKLQSEIVVRQRVEDELRHGLELAERSRRALLSALEDHRKAEEALRGSEEKFALAFQTAPYGIAITRIEDGTFLEVNDSFRSITGFTNEEALSGTSIGLNLWVNPEDRTRVLEALRAGRPVFREEHLFRTKHGKIITGLFSAALIRLTGGPCILSSIDDVTERKRNEVALRESEERLRDITFSVGDWVWEVDQRGVYTYSSVKAYDLLGRTPEEVVGKTPFDFMSGEEATRVGAIFSEIAARKGPIEDLENWNLRKDGERLCLLTNGVPILDEAGNLKGYRGVDRDITDRKRAEREREQLQEQLRMSQRIEAVGKLAGGIAHDFNNLLSVILSYTGFALEVVKQGDPLREDLLEVKKSGERAAALTRQLLAFSRKQVLQPEPLSLNQIAAGVEKMLRRILGEDIDVVQVLAPDLGLTLADPGQMEQVLMNLVVNARDAMPEGGRLTIETANAELDVDYAARHVAVKPGSYVQLSVTDTGCGMDSQTQARIFEPFFTTKEKGKGTGLGLSMVYGIVKQSGGNVWVYSEPGRGTTFKVYLPRDLSGSVAAASRPVTVPLRATGTETILVVEDEESLRKVAKRALAAGGYTVLTASEGREALRIAAQHPGEIQLLLTDVVMPGMDGRTLAQELSKRRSAIKVLYMSGYTDDAVVHHGVLEAGTHFLSKPFTAVDLARKVREVLDGAGPGRGAVHERAAVVDADLQPQPLAREALRAIPEGIVERMGKAAIAARYDEMVALIDTIETTEPRVAAELRRMVDLFDYDGLRALLRR
jgi:two-component system cell cycle sensor histidine kinase/response regulator CckA